MPTAGGGTELVRGARRVEIPAGVRGAVSELHRLAGGPGCLSDPGQQRRLTERLARVREWRDWTSSLSIDLRPLQLGAGLDIARGTASARALLVGLAATLGRVPSYAVGGELVTEVRASGGSASSHSENDLPAPPHTAGFFEPVPPMACVFACVRPHPGGGAETFVVDVDSVLASSSGDLIERWRRPGPRLRTSARLGGSERPLRLLRTARGLPFLRYRHEYAIADAADPLALAELATRVEDPAHWTVVPLRRDEILIHWNGSPHGRLPQVGPTPTDPDQRRLLLRCRVQPDKGWEANFTCG